MSSKATRQERETVKARVQNAQRDAKHWRGVRDRMDKNDPSRAAADRAVQRAERDIREGGRD